MTESVAELAWTVDDAVRAHAAARPDDIAFVGRDRDLTWRELDEAADRAAGLLERRGIGPGDRVGWLGKNDMGYPVTLLGAWRRRAALVGLNWRLPVPGLAASAGAVDLAYLVAGAEFADIAPSVMPADRCRVLDQTALPWPDEPAGERLAPLPGDEALIYYTSGTTGAPKVVPLTHEAVASTLRYADVHGFDRDSRLLIVPPVFHAAGATWIQYGLEIGATQVLSADATPPGLVRTLSEQRITHVILVPALIRAVLDRLRSEPTPLPHLRHVGYGTSAIAGALLDEAIDALGCEFGQVYGMTEGGGGLCFLFPEDHRPGGAHPERLASAGRPGPGVDLSVRDVATGAELPAGESGELWFRAPSMTRGYLGDPAATARTIVDGWLNSRDIGYVDADGYVYVRGRSDDMIVTGGENVHPAEVENTIVRFPAVQECAVYGVPDERWGQRVCASVVPRTPGLTADEVRAYCREHLPGYKVPKLIRIVGELPRNATGKVLRSRLVEDTAEDTAREAAVADTVAQG